MSPVRLRDARFVWPQDWSLGSCANPSERHLRIPENETGEKDPFRVHSLVVGLNPGLTELKERRYFVGRAGQTLVLDRYAALWERCPPTETLVTNLVKIATANASELNTYDRAAVDRCVTDCFTAELVALPALSHIYLLGEDAVRRFRELVWGQLEGGVRVYALRHPSRSGTEPKLDELLRRQLDSPIR